jgi:hypothetical protein
MMTVTPLPQPRRYPFYHRRMSVDVGRFDGSVYLPALDNMPRSQKIVALAYERDRWCPHCQARRLIDPSDNSIVCLSCHTTNIPQANLNEVTRIHLVYSVQLVYEMHQCPSCSSPSINVDLRTRVPHHTPICGSCGAEM